MQQQRSAATRSCMSAARLMLCWLSALAVLHVPTARAMIDNDLSIDVSGDDGFFSTWQFEFAAGGRYTLVALTLQPSDSWTARNHSVQVILASDAELAPIRSASMDEVCATPAFVYSPVTWSVQLGAHPHPSSARFVLPSTTADWYRLVVLNCDQDAFKMVYSDIAVNPGGEYLSRSEQPYKVMYGIFLWAWVALVAVWLLHLLLHRHFNIAAQLLLTLLPLSKGALCLPNMLYWRHASQTGSLSPSLAWATLLTETGERMAWATVAFFMATGWRIMLRAVHPLTQRIVLSLIAFLGLAFFLFSYFQGFLVFLLLFSYTMLLRIVFAALVESGNVLLRQLHVLQRADIDPALCQPLQDRMRMFKQLQLSILAYLCVDVIFQLWSAIFLKSTPWVAQCVDHALSILLCLALGWIFRIRPFNPFYLHVALSLINSASPAYREQAAAALAPAADDAAPDRTPTSSLLRGASGGGGGGSDYQSLPDSHDENSSAVITVHASASLQSDEAGRGQFGSPTPLVSRRRLRGNGDGIRSLCAWRRVGSDQLWHIGCPVPAAALSEPDAALLGAEAAAAQRRRAVELAGRDLPPVLILENDDSTDDAPPMLGLLPLADEMDAADVTLPGGSGIGGAWSALPASALPYVPAQVRQRLDAEERFMQQDSRGLQPLPTQPASSVGRSRSSSSYRPVSQRSSFPEHI